MNLSQGSGDAPVKTLALVSCVKEKLEHPARAIEIYQGFFFRSSLRYAAQFSPDAIYILSGKYGLLAPDDLVEPYDCHLGEQSPAYRAGWSQRVLASLEKVSRPEYDRYILLVEPAYREGLLARLSHVLIPFAGLSLAEQMQCYQNWYAGIEN